MFYSMVVVDMIYNSNTTRSLIGLLAFFLLINCNGKSPQQPIDAPPLVITFSQQINGKQTQIADYEIEWKNQIGLKNAVSKEIPFGSGGYGGSAITKDKNSNEIVVFVVIIDEMGDRRAFALTPYKENNGTLQILENQPFEVTNFAGGKVYGFFIAGIGIKPVEPVNLLIENKDSIYAIPVLPNNHTLPKKSLLNIDGQTLGLRTDSPTVFFDFRCESEALPYLPFFVYKINEEWNAAIVHRYQLNQSWGVHHTGVIISSYDFSLFLVQE